MSNALRKGENMPLPTVSSAEIRCQWPISTYVQADVSALLLSGRRVRTDADFIFYNQTEAADGAAEHLGKRSTGDGFVEDRIAVNLFDLPADIDAVAFVLSVDTGHRLAELGAVSASVIDGGGQSLATFKMGGLTVERAAVVLDIYRRGHWKVRAVGQGYHDGLAGLARDFGVAVEDEPPLPLIAVVDQTSHSAVDWTNPPVPAGYELPEY